MVLLSLTFLANGVGRRTADAGNDESRQTKWASGRLPGLQSFS